MAKTKAKTKALAIPKISEIKKSDEFRALCTDCAAIIDQAIFSAKMAMVEAMHEVGKNVVTSEVFRKYGKGNREFVVAFAKEIHRSSSEVYRAIQFYERYPNLGKAVSELPGGKELTWGGVKKYLTADPEAEKNCKHHDTTTLTIVLKKCADCGALVDKKTKSE